MGEEELALQFGADIAMLKQVGINPVVVHGGGPQINAMLKRLEIQSTFVDGLRVTDAAMVEVVEMVLAGTVNKYVAGLINRAGRAGGGYLRQGWRADPRAQAEAHQARPGQPDRAGAGPGLCRRAGAGGCACDPCTDRRRPDSGDRSGRRRRDGQTYNINADTVAGAVAGALEATRLLMLTDVPGVLDERQASDPGNDGGRGQRGSSGMITGGMIPKVETCVDAVRRARRAR